ncbi:MAG: hypothetical protein IIA35_07925 [Proteobacteria bacterium]|nr:hypothetical protein [Pseudomonadota bacterium]
MAQNYEYQKRIEVLPQYSGLENQTVAVLVEADLSTLYEHPDTVAKIAGGVVGRIRRDVPSAQVVDPGMVINWQYRTPQWNALPYGQIAEHLDVEGLLALARPLGLGGPAGDGPTPPLAPLGQRIAVAADEAFAFSYPLVIEGWRRAGAEIVAFSPLADLGPDADADAVYLPGGYPELHAGTLAAAEGFLDGLRRAAARGAAVYGECGGYMVLGKGLIDADGNRHAMAGLLALETSFKEPKLHLGYRRAATLETGPLGAAGAAFRGHEFHYTGVAGEGPGQALFQAADAEGRDLGNVGLRDGTVAGSFIHLIDREEE